MFVRRERKRVKRQGGAKTLGVGHSDFINRISEKHAQSFIEYHIYRLTSYNLKIIPVLFQRSSSDHSGC